jgi:hypothetical protein
MSYGLQCRVVLLTVIKFRQTTRLYITEYSTHLIYSNIFAPYTTADLF